MANVIQVYIGLFFGSRDLAPGIGAVTGAADQVLQPVKLFGGGRGQGKVMRAKGGKFG